MSVRNGRNGRPTDIEPLPGMLGRDPKMLEVYRLTRLAATTDLPVLIVGETGTGKELVARALHTLSGDPGRPFEPVNCAEISESLAEGELFGWEKGAFTGAVGRRAGPLELADGGTLLLDEACSLAPALQAKLLRALEDGRFRRVGGTSWVRPQFRVVTAVSEPRKLLMSAGRWRTDFAHRVAGFEVTLPPLRERREDIDLLAEAFLGVMSDRGPPLEAGVLALLSRYSWPGNVRELRLMMRRLAALARPYPLNAQDVLGVLPELADDLDERARVAAALDAHGGNVTQAARALGVGRTTLYKLLHLHGMRPQVDHR